MPETFKCPSCSAPLDFAGTTFQKCKFCGSSIIVPSETFHRAGTPSFQNFDLSNLTGRALKIAEIQKEIERGNKINAIKIFRETFGTGLKEAKDAVEAMERGEGIDISGMNVQTNKVHKIQLNPEVAKKIGYTVGGSILATTIIIGVITLVIVGAAIFITFYAINSVENAKPPTIAQTENPVETKPQIAVEIVKFGGEGNGAGKFTDNRSVAVDGKGKVYSANYNDGKIQVFDESGKFKTQWLSDKDMNLYDLAADREGNLYVAQNKGIFKYKGETGELLKKFESRRVVGIALTSDEKIVAIANNKNIVILDKDLKIIKEITDAHTLASSSFGFDKLAVDGDGVIYVVDRTSDEIAKFSQEGKFLDKFKTDISSPNDIAINNRGHLYLSDTSEIYIFTSDGKQINSFKTDQAFGMAFNNNDELYVASRPFVVKYKINVGYGEK